MNRIDRLFGILLRLQYRGRLRARDLANHFEVSERTIYRDIAALNEVPIISLPNAGYELPEGFTLPPLFFTSGEAVTITLAMHLLLAQTAGRTSLDAEHALAKITAILPRAMRQWVHQRSTIVRFFAADRRFDLDDTPLTQLQQAIAARRVVRLRYHSLSSDEQSDRVVEPLTLTYHNEIWYLGAYCRLRQGLRSFRLDRIDGLHLLNTTCCPHNVAPTTSSFESVRIRFTPAILRWVRERQHFGYITEEPGGVLRYVVTDPFEMLPWLLSWGAGAEVLEPAPLRARVRAEAQKLLVILT